MSTKRKHKVTLQVTFVVDALSSDLTKPLEDLACAMVAQVESLRDDHGFEYEQTDYQLHVEQLSGGHDESAE